MRSEKPHRSRAPIETALAIADVTIIAASGAVSSKKSRDTGASSATT